MKEHPYRSIFSEITISENCYLLYNSVRHIPIKINKKQKFFFELLFDTEEFRETHIADKERKSFKSFVKQLEKIGFLSTEELYIDKNELSSYYFSDKKTIYLHLTHRCNLDCSYCYNKKQRYNKTDLSFEEWKIILDKIIPHFSSIILTGGEPTLYPFIRNIVSYLKAQNEKISISLISNASINFKEQNLKDTLRCIDNLTLSCDNIDDDDTERIGFNRAIFFQNMEYLRKIGMGKRVSISSVFRRGCLNKIKNVKSYCQEHGHGFSASVFIPNDSKEKEKMPSLEEFSEINTKIQDYTETPMEDESIKHTTITCGAGTSIFSIDAQGDIYPCQSFHVKEFYLGNLLRQEFKDIFYSTKALLLRYANDVNYKEQCNTCNVKYICAGGCVANTFTLEGGLLNHPEILCPYYKQGALNRLRNVEF